MLSSLISVKLVAMASALGLNTSEWKNPSPDIVAQVEKIEKALPGIADTAKADQAQVEINEAYAKIRELADKGDKDAQFAMGHLLRQSNQQGSVEQSIRYFEQAAQQGQLQAMNNFGIILTQGARDADTQAKGVDWIKKASDAGDNSARRNLAQIYLRGIAGQKVDPDTAKKLLETAVAEKDAEATFELSQFYSGIGGANFLDGEKTWDLLNKAAELGSANALDTLGSILFNGGKIVNKEIPADPKAAVAKFQSLADQNNPVGLRKLAGVYQEGIGGVTKDFKKAFELYTRAAQGNDGVAQFVLANMYNEGVDLDPKDEKVEVVPNASTALSLYRAAAQNRVPLAHLFVGIAYEVGRTVDRDLTKAFLSFQQAAQANVPAAMQKVGLYYLNGAGTVKDPVAAASWFARAGQAGLAEGSLAYGQLAEAGLTISSNDKSTPFYAAADSYMQALDSPNSNDNVRLEALLRLGNLYFRGVMVARGEEPKPDYERAYIFFKQASDIDANSKVASEALAQAKAKLTQDQIKRADTSVEGMKKDREARRQKAQQQQQGQQGNTAPAANPNN